MKGFFEWFKSNSKMKRWMFLILVGVILMCYSISKILVTDRLDKIADIAIIVAGFVSGFLSIIIGLVYMNKRTLELLVKETDKREKKDLNSLIFNRKVYSQGPKIVVIGGSTGLNTVLRGLKKYTDNLTAIVTVSDYGDKSSDSRKILETLPLEDIKQSMIALATNEEEMDKLLNCKFSNAKLKSLSFGDIYMLAMQNIYSDFSKSVKKSSDVLNITGKVLPVTMEEMKICAELEDGTVVEQRSEIPNMVSKKSSKVNRIFVNPTNCRVAPGVVEAIEEADAIIIGPGNLYTNVIPNLLVKGVARAIKNCKGFKIYISNIMTEPGQTSNYTLSDHVKAIVDHVGEGIIDYCIYDTGEIVPEIIRKYNSEGSEPVEQDVAKAKAQGMHLLKRDLATVDGEYIRHNSDAVAASIIELICEDLKFRDMQNNPEYMILSDKLKYKKKKIKENKAHKVGKLNKLDPDKKSKFFNKYQKRISSIKESEEKFKQKNKKNKINKLDDKKDKENKKNIKVSAAENNLSEKESKAVSKTTVKRTRKREEQEDSATVKSQLLNSSETLNIKVTDSMKRTKEIEEKQKRDELEKKEFFEAINKNKK